MLRRAEQAELVELVDLAGETLGLVVLALAYLLVGLVALGVLVAPGALLLGTKVLLRMLRRAPGSRPKGGKM